MNDDRTPDPKPAASRRGPLSRLTFWRAGCTMAALGIAAVVGIGSSLYIAEIRRYEEHNQAAVALGTLRCVARIVDRYQEREGKLPECEFGQMLDLVSPLSKPKTDPLYVSLPSDDVAFTTYFTHPRAQGGICADKETGRFRHQEAELVDPYGKPYQFLRAGHSGYTAGLVLSRKSGYVLNTGNPKDCAYVLVSNGMDLRYGTDDDIRVTSETPRDIKEMVPALRKPWGD